MVNIEVILSGGLQTTVSASHEEVLAAVFKYTEGLNNKRTEYSLPFSGNEHALGRQFILVAACNSDTTVLH